MNFHLRETRFYQLVPFYKIQIAMSLLHTIAEKSDKYLLKLN